MRFIVAIGFALCMAATGLRADPKPTSDWQFQLTPYIWMSGLQGDVGRLPNGTPISVDLSFSDVLENLDIAGMVYGSARKDDWVFFLDSTYVSSSLTEGLGGVFFTEGSYSSDTTTLALAVGRQIVETDQASASAYIGARAWWIDSTTTLRGIGGRNFVQSTSESWVDPLVGITGQYQPNDKWTLTGAFEVGGFGVGADSDWSALLAATYRISDRFGLSIGWRHLEVDYDSADTLFDVRQSGPLLGATFVF